jgi:HEPN domain-containing protein
MQPKRPRPDTAEAWLEHARSDLKIAQASIPDAYLEDLCYHAQQCAEKALKALLVIHKK